MIYAISAGHRKGASPNCTATCPLCGGEVIAKCGSIVTWHWAHRALDCDPWAEPESTWHIQWKNRFNEQCREFIIGNHRADILASNGWVVELQHSPISSGEIRLRERFYGDRMVWVLDLEQFLAHFVFRSKDGYTTFRWKWPRKSWWAAQRSVFLDFGGDMLFLIKKVYHGTPCGGWGRWVMLHDIVDWLQDRHGEPTDQP